MKSKSIITSKSWQFLAVTFVCFLLTSGVAAAQDYKKLLKSADKAGKEEDYTAAIGYYVKALEQLEDTLKQHYEIFYKIGFAFMKIKEYGVAINYLSESASLAGDAIKSEEKAKILDLREWCIKEKMNQSIRPILIQNPR
ncbi:MAG: hypothetical protein IIA88_09055, partial [Bacteroidetes bacterium]|nr:hypothetical protein [Bacteroidota bacterium]